MKGIFNSIPRKCTLLIIAVGLLLVFIISTCFPTIFYNIMKPHLIDSIANMVNNGAIKQSYILSNNGDAYRLRKNEDIKNLISEYYTSDDQKAINIKNELTSNFEFTGFTNTRENADGDLVEDAGAILVKSYTFLTTSRGDAFYDENAEGYVHAVLNSDWYVNLNTENPITDFSPVISIPTENGAREFMCFTVTYEVDDFTCIPIVLTPFDELKSQFGNFDELGIDDYWLICHDAILYKNLGDESNIKLAQYPDYMYSQNQYEPMVRDNGDEIIAMALISYDFEDYRIVVNITKETLLAPYEDIFLMFEIFLLVVIVVIIIIVAFALNKSLVRLKVLDKELDSVRKGNYDINLYDSGKDEVSRLTHTINIMLNRIQDDIHQIVLHQDNEQRLQYSLMISAIDPHFIYNTLNTVTALAIMGKCEDIVHVNKALISTLKDRLQVKTYKTFDTIQVEREVIEQYILIQNYLCHNEIKLEFYVSEEALDLLIPKNILHPLVENSIKHGILKHKGDTPKDLMQGIISINVYKEDDKVVIAIKDNGIGMDEQTMQSFFFNKPNLNDCEKEHIGVLNVRMRLDYLYKDNYEFKVESEAGKGTIITIKLSINMEHHPE